MLYEIIDRIGQTQDQMREILVRMEMDLKYHIKRTDLLQEEVELLREALISHVSKPFPWKKASIIIGLLASVVGIASKFGLI